MGAVHSAFVLFYFHPNLLLFLGRFICPIKQRLHLLFLGAAMVFFVYLTDLFSVFFL